MRVTILTALLACCLTLTAPIARSGTVDPRAYAHRLVIAKWHSESEWRALDAIVRPESGWNPCRVYPSRTDCSYAGSNSCGIPQANPCPVAWRGRLWSMWRAQCDWIVAYIAARYGTPSAALAFRITHHWY